MKVVQCDRCHCIYTPNIDSSNCATMIVAKKFTKVYYDLCAECIHKFYADFIGENLNE